MEPQRQTGSGDSVLRPGNEAGGTAEASTAITSQDTSDQRKHTQSYRGRSLSACGVPGCCLVCLLLILRITEHRPETGIQRYPSCVVLEYIQNPINKNKGWFQVCNTSVTLGGLESRIILGQPSWTSCKEFPPIKSFLIEATIQN